MLLSIFNCFKSLLWAILLLIMEVWVLGIFFMQAAGTFIQDHPPDDASKEVAWFQEHFASLLTTMTLLFQSVTGGVDWAEPAGAVAVVHPVYGLIYVLFIAFTQFAVLNIVTGQFVEEARLTASQ